MKEIQSKKFFSKKIERKDTIDTGMVLVLILLISFIATKNILHIKIAIVLLLITIVLPAVLKPIAVGWFGISELIGSVMSRAILAVVYIVFVMPVAFFRRLIGKDPMRFKKWKENDQTVFVVRNQTFSPIDIDKPY